MDWVRLGHSGVDLTGVGGVLQDVTPEQLAAHGKKNDAWIAIRGKMIALT
jgi:cytochrome-b5 reductase